MLPLFSFDTIAMVSIALAGFSGLTAAFRSRPMQEWVEWERIWFWYILIWSIGALMFSLLPAVLGGLGIASSLVWTVCSVSLALFILAGLALGARRGIKLHGHGVFHPRWAATAATLLPAISAIALLFCSVAGVLVSPWGAYQLALFLILGQACGCFFLFLRYPLSG
jgi:hypothetical protein